VCSLINSGAPYEIPTKLSDLLFKVRSIIGELYTEEWHDRMLTDWMNEALNVICTKADFPFMEAEATVYTVVGQDAYQLPAGFKKIIKVHTGSTETSKADDRETVSNSYILFNDTIIIPASASAYEFKIRYYRYLPYFDWANVNSTCKLPRQYEDMLIDYAVMRAKQQEELYDVANIHMNMFAKRFDDMVVDLRRRIDADYPSIRPLTNMY
jgi:hypothetical protein